MPLTTPISGKLGKITYGAGPTTLAIKKWSFKPSANSLDVSNTTDGRRRIPGLFDAEYSFDLHVDTAATLESDLQVGTIATLNLFTDGTKKYTQANVIIESIDYSVEIEGSYDASVTAKLASGVPAISPA